MTSFVEGPVRVTVPATSANLGPGFDSLGLALDLRDALTAQVLPAGLQVEVSGSGADGVPRDETHLVVRSMRAAFEAMGEQPPGLRLTCANVIPHARGLGSSSAAIVGGVVLARALVAGGSLLMDDESAFDLTARLEGHPDNVAPAFYGGFVISGRDERFYAVRSSVDPRVSTVVFVPGQGVRTEVARGLLPASVPHADAAANAARAALLVAALTREPAHLLEATDDRLHQQYRAPAMMQSFELMTSLRAQGHAAVISGAGPTVLVLSDADGVEALRAAAPEGWQVLAPGVRTAPVTAAR